MRKIGNRVLIILVVVALLHFLWNLGLKDGYETKSFLSYPVELPDSVLRIDGDKIDVCPFPEHQMRMVFYYGPNECMQCCVYHAYELSCMFTQNDFITIPLFAPKQDDVADVISIIRQNRYEFPMYVIIDDQKEFIRSIPSGVKYHNFLLGRDNVPLFVGDPVHSAEDADEFEMVVQSHRE